MVVQECTVEALFVENWLDVLGPEMKSKTIFISFDLNILLWYETKNLLDLTLIFEYRDYMFISNHQVKYCEQKS